MDVRNPVESYRERAAEIRALAEQAKTEENREELLALATRYERLAARVAKPAGEP